MKTYYLLNEPFRFLRYQYTQGSIMYGNTLPIGINHEALEILRLCDGTKTLDDIISINTLLYNDEKKVSNLVTEFLESVVENKIVSVLTDKLDTPIKIAIDGSKEFWTPLHVTLEMTQQCPLYCKHCFVNAGTGKNMKRDLMLSVGREIVNLGIKSVQLTGGEPLIHPNFLELLDLLLNGNIRVNITTSGYYENDELVDCIARISAVNGYVQISLDGMANYHNNIRGREDAFEKTINCIEKFIAHGVRVVVATCYINQDMDEFDKLCEYVKSIGVHEIKFGVVESKGRAKDNNLETGFEKYRRISENIDFLRNKYQDDSFLIGKEEELEMKKAEFPNCGCGYNILKIGTDGCIYDCVFSERAIGKIDVDNGLQQYLLKNAKDIFARTQKVAPCKDVCGECEELSRCKGCMVKGRESACSKAHLFM